MQAPKIDLSRLWPFDVLYDKLVASLHAALKLIHSLQRKHTMSRNTSIARGVITAAGSLYLFAFVQVLVTELLALISYQQPFGCLKIPERTLIAA